MPARLHLPAALAEDDFQSMVYLRNRHEVRFWLNCPVVQSMKYKKGMKTEGRAMKHEKEKSESGKAVVTVQPVSAQTLAIGDHMTVGFTLSMLLAIAAGIGLAIA
jgi:hypothetical protein